MSIISKESFEKLTRDEKKKLRQIYKDMKEEPSLAYAHEYAEKCEWLEDYFGKENLQSKIKTWEDLEKDGFSVEGDYLCEFDNYNDDKAEIFKEAISYKGEFSDKLILKAIATLKIAKLIEIGYGGVVTDEEWKDYRVHKYCVVLDMCGKLSIECRKGNSHEFIAFHTIQQTEEFLSYPKNIELVRNYNMI